MLARWLAPARRRGVELLDLPETPDAVRAAAMRDLERSNTLFGGTRSLLRALRPFLTPGNSTTVLDVGTGTGDIPARIRAAHASVRVIGLDASRSLAATAARRLDAAVAGDALRALVSGVTGITPVIGRDFFWRITATWAVRPDSITRR